MKNKLPSILIAVLVLLSAGNLLFSYTNLQKSDTLRNDLSQLSNRNPQLIAGPTGAQGITGSVGPTGTPGINAISFNTTTVRDVPIIGQTGPAGKDARELVIRYNDQTGSVETQYAGDEFWNVVVPCEKLNNSCPTTQSTQPSQPNTLESF